MEPTSQQYKKALIQSTKYDIVKPSFLLNRFIAALRLILFYLIAVFSWEVLKINLNISIIIALLLGPLLAELIFFNNKHRKYRISVTCPFCNVNFYFATEKAMLKKEFTREGRCPSCREQLVINYRNEYY